MRGKLILKDGIEFSGELFGGQSFAHGEVVFNTGMTGYELSMSDPSYRGQILVFTFPLLGNYGIPGEECDEFGLLKFFESDDAHIRGVICSELSPSFSHHNATKSLHDWLAEKKIPILSGIDTRALTQHLRETGATLGQIVPENAEPIAKIPDPNHDNLVAEVSIREAKILSPKNPKYRIAAIDTGIKNNILREFLKRDAEITLLPWNAEADPEEFDGLFLSNGPGDPEVVAEIIGKNIHAFRAAKKPIFGICLGNQILALSIGGKTRKMKYGHRGVNQPCQDLTTKKAVITSQNHGFEVIDNSLPEDFETRYVNLNDGSVEGICAKSEPISSVQFHPEACAGPEDTRVLFDAFLEQCAKAR